MIMQLSVWAFQGLAEARSSFDKVFVLSGSGDRMDWEVVGEFAGRVRQARRHKKAEFKRIARTIQANSFRKKKNRVASPWPISLPPWCFFLTAPGQGCPCLSDGFFNRGIFSKAHWMPKLDTCSKPLLVHPFQLYTFRRVAQLQAEMRHLGS